MQVSSHRLRSSLRALRPIHVAAALGLAASQPAQAMVFWDEVTFYLTYASYSPGDTVSTTFYFGTKPAIDLSSFEFTLSWDNALATPVAAGPGSVADWVATLGTQGNASYGNVGSQVIKGSWTTDPSGGPTNLYSTSYSQLARTTFAFETSAALKVPFVVTIELTNLKDATGDVVDLGSGFINWATMTPVPEPSTWLSFVFGVALLGRLRRSILH